MKSLIFWWIASVWICLLSINQMIAQSEKGYQNFTHAGMMVGAQFTIDNIVAASGFQFQTVQAYRFNENFTLGLGLGFEHFRSTHLLPVFIDGRAFLNGKKADRQTYFYGGIGYALGWDDNLAGNTAYKFKGGSMMQIGIGKSVVISDKFTFLFDLGYKLQQIKLQFEGGTQANKESSNYHFLSIRVGIGLR